MRSSEGLLERSGVWGFGHPVPRQVARLRDTWMAWIMGVLGLFLGVLFFFFFFFFFWLPPWGTVLERGEACKRPF